MDLMSMGEQDLRETIVRPFIERLGYRYGTSAHIRTEVTLRYANAFLGLKNKRKDPPLRGRADYILEIVDCGRWVVEVKAPDQRLTDNDSEQAYTYATHPEVGAYFYLLTNGLEWKLYAVGKPYTPVLSWAYEQMDNMMPVVVNALSPEAFIKRQKALIIDTGKPLAEGIGSNVKVRGGFVTYDEHTTDQPHIAAALRILSGQRAPITGGSAYRTEEGKIEVRINMRPTNAIAERFQASDTQSDMIFATTAGYISNDAIQPTIFTNIVSMGFKKGQLFGGFMGIDDYIAPFDIQLTAFSQAVAYIQGETCFGIHEISYLINVGRQIVTDPHASLMAGILNNLRLTGRGVFEVYL